MPNNNGTDKLYKKLTLPNILKLGEADLIVLLESWLKREGFQVTVDDNLNVYGKRGKGISPLLIAHTDMVHKLPPAHVFCNNDWIVGIGDNGEQCGIGADDKNGVSAIVQIVSKLDKTHPLQILFAADEERGCKGSNALDMGLLKNVAYMVQLDRRTHLKTQYMEAENDVIQFTNGIQVASDEFKAALKPMMDKHEFTFCSGTCTDVGELVHRKVGVAGINMSVGYVREHSQKEAVHVPSYIKSVAFAYDVIRGVQVKKYEHKPEPPKWEKKKWNEEEENWAWNGGVGGDSYGWYKGKEWNSKTGRWEKKRPFDEGGNGKGGVKKDDDEIPENEIEDRYDANQDGWEWVKRRGTGYYVRRQKKVLKLLEGGKKKAEVSTEEEDKADDELVEMVSEETDRILASWTFCDCCGQKKRTIYYYVDEQVFLCEECIAQLQMRKEDGVEVLEEDVVKWTRR